MTMSISEKTVGTWHAELPGGIGNWIATVNQLDDNRFQVDYRFRYYWDDKIGEESEDEKSWYGGIAECSEAEIIDTMRSLCKALNTEYDEVLMDDNGLDDFMERFMEWECVNVVREETLQ